MTVLTRALAALAVLALATPALPCEGMKQKATTAQSKSTTKDQVAKTEKKDAPAAKAETAQKPASAQN